jgi:hypothetical protein
MKKHKGPDSGSVMHSKPLDVEYSSKHSPDISHTRTFFNFFVEFQLHIPAPGLSVWICLSPKTRLSMKK